MLAINNPALKTKPVTIEELINNPETYNVGSFRFSPSITIKDITFDFTSIDYPLTTGKVLFMGDDNFLAINEEYYASHKKEIDEAIKVIVEKSTLSTIKIPKELISVELMQVVAGNENIKTVYLGREDYSLTSEIYNVFKDSKIENIRTNGVDKELEENFDSKISFNRNKKLIGYSNYEDLKNKDSFYLEEPLGKDRYKYLQYVKDGAKFSFGNCSDFQGISDLINELNRLGKNCKFVIEVSGYSTKDFGDFEVKNKFVKYLLENQDLISVPNINIKIHGDEYSMGDFIKYEKRLIELIKPAMNLSPMEKYLYAYNVTKQFKEYKENEEEAMKARNLYDILDNEYMVCVGYSVMLSDLLEKLGIESEKISVEVDVTMDKVANDITVIPDTVVNSSGGHARVLVNLQDPKYGVDGFYYADPTWDNCMDKDTYNYCLMTAQEYDLMYRANYLRVSDTNEFYTANNLEEFYFKVNYYLDKEERKNKENTEKNYQENIQKFKNEFKAFMEVLKRIDSKNFEWYDAVYNNLYNINIFLPNADRFMTRIKNVIDANKNRELTDAFFKMDSKYYIIKNYSLNKCYSDSKKSLIREMISYIKKIDVNKYNELTNKYTEVLDYNFEVTNDYLQNFVTEIGEYIVIKNNNTISGETLMSAIESVYEKAYGYSGESLASKMDEIIGINKNRQKKCFPIRYKVLVDGTKIPIENEENKFDIDCNKISRSI